MHGEQRERNRRARTESVVMPVWSLELDRMWVQVAAAALLLLGANLLDLMTTFDALDAGATEVNPLGSWILGNGIALEAKLIAWIAVTLILVRRARLGDPTVALWIVTTMGVGVLTIAWSNAVFLGV